VRPHVEPLRETPDATRDELTVPAVRNPIEMTGRTPYRQCGGRALAGFLVRVREVQVQRREEALRSPVRDALRMVHGERVPPERVRRCGLMPREVVRGDRRLEVVGPNGPGLLEQPQRDGGLSLPRDSLGAQRDHTILRIDHPGLTPP